MFDSDVDDAFSQLIEQWNIAERRIKKAENVRANEIVSSAIFELRYAGRKVVDAIQLLQAAKWKDDAREKARILAFLADATEDCVKAKHDAIDAMMLFVATWFKRTEDQLGLGNLQKYFPNYVALVGKICDIQEKIADSRGDRMVSRDGTYNEIETTGYDEILALYDAMKRSEDRVAAQVRIERRKELINFWGMIVGLLIGAIGIFLALLSLKQ